MPFNLPRSLMCLNGTRLSCSPSSPECGQRFMFYILLLLICATIMVILHIQTPLGLYKSSATAAGIESARTWHPDEPTDLTNPDLHYGVIFDCGSSGSRAYIYYWPTPEPSISLNIHQVISDSGHPLSKKITPGLSTYDDNTSFSGEYLKPLIEFAEHHIPSDKHSTTPLYIMATAGMRLIDPRDASDILYDIIHDVSYWTSFKFNADHVELISGKQEGLYSWISVNYMLGKLGQADQQTVGVIDMGGGSMQITFPTSKTSQGDDIMMVDLGLPESSAEASAVYTHSFLGYGANSALQRYQEGLVLSLGTPRALDMLVPPQVVDPCLLEDQRETVRAFNRTVFLTGSGDVLKCMDNLKPLLDKDKCVQPLCSMNGVYQPHISPHLTLYGISEYWYSFYDVFSYSSPYNRESLLRLAQKFCSTSWEIIQQNFDRNLYPHADLERIRTQCFKFSWVVTVLHHGLNFPPDYTNLIPVNEINSQEVQWSLGALLYKTAHHDSIHVSGQHYSVTTSYSSASYILIICISIVLLSIIILCRKIRPIRNLPSLKSMPSVHYFTTPQNLADQVLLTQKNIIYP